MIEEIKFNLPFISSINFILQHTSILSKQLARQVMIIIYEVFNDIENPGKESIDETNFGVVFSNLCLFSSDSNSSFDEELLSLLD